MRFLRSVWFRLILEILFILILLVLAVVSMASADGMLGFSGFIGAAVLVGCLLFYVTFDLMGEIRRSFIGALRLILGIIGCLIVVAAGVFAQVFYAVTVVYSSSTPWEHAFCGQWLASGIIMFIAYWIISSKGLNKIFYPVFQLLSVAAGYLLFVILGYITATTPNLAISGFYGLIICGIAVVVLFFVIKKNGIPFAAVTGTGKRPSRSSKPVYNDDSGVEETDERLDGAGGLWNNKMESAVSAAIGRAYKSVYGYYGRVDASKTKINYLVNKGALTIKVYGTVVYEITSTYNPEEAEYYAGKFKDDLQDVLDKVGEALGNEIGEAIDSVQEKYRGFDGEWDIDVNVNGKLVL